MIEPNIISEQLENFRQYGDPDSIPKVRDAMFYSNISGITPDKIFDYVDELNEEIHGSATSLLKKPSDSTADIMSALTDNFVTIEDSANVRHNIRVQTWKNYIKNMPPAKYGFMIAAMNLDPFSLGEYFTRQLGRNLNDPKEAGEIKAIYQAVKEVQSEYTVKDWQKYPGLAGQISKTMLEFAMLPEAKTMGAVARNFALQQALQAPSAQEEQMRLGEVVAERAKGAAKAGLVGYGVGVAGKFIPNPFQRIPLVTGGFMGMTALEGGTPDQILETGITILGFEAIGFIKSGKRREAIKAAKEYNPDLKKVPVKELETVIDEFDKVVLPEEKVEKPAPVVKKPPVATPMARPPETGAIKPPATTEQAGKPLRDMTFEEIDQLRRVNGKIDDAKTKQLAAEMIGNPTLVEDPQFLEAGGFGSFRQAYNQMKEQTPPAPAQPQGETQKQPSRVGEVLYPEIKGEGEIKQRKMAQRLAEAIDDSLVKETAEGQTYQVSARRGESGRAAKAAKFVMEEPERAKRIAFVKEAPPEGIYPEDVAIAVYEKALAEGDFLTIRDMMNYRPEVETELGRRIEALKRNKPEEDLYAAMKDAKQTKEKEYTRRHKDKELKKTKREISKIIKDEIGKATLALKDWTDFIESLRC